jgi:hypothetical protein
MAHLNHTHGAFGPLVREIAPLPSTIRKDIVLAPAITKQDDLNCLELCLTPKLGMVKVGSSLTRF